MNDLAARHCRTMDGQRAMPAAEITRLLAAVPGWALVDGALHKQLDFADFHHTMAFVNALAWVAHREDHHPDLQLSYNRCTVRFNTHAVGGLSINDFICAAKVDALVGPEPP